MTVAGKGKTAWAFVLVCGIALLTACGASQNGVPRGIAVQAPLPRGVMSAHKACALVLKRPRGTFVGVKQVHLVLTNYAKGEPLASRGDISTGMPPRTLVWVVEVHAKKINVPHSTPANTPELPVAEFSVVMNARTGRVTDFGLGGRWPLPLWKVGPMINLSARC